MFTRQKHFRLSLTAESVEKPFDDIHGAGKIGSGVT